MVECVFVIMFMVDYNLRQEFCYAFHSGLLMCYEAFFNGVILLQILKMNYDHTSGNSHY